MTKYNNILKWIAVLAALAVLLTGCANKGAAQKEEDKNVNEPAIADTVTDNEVFLILSQKYGFSLEAPPDWEDKVIIKEDEQAFTIAHKTNSDTAMAKNPIFLTIVAFGSQEKWEQESQKTDQPFPYEKIGLVDGTVFAKVQLFDFPYSDEDKEDKDEFSKLLSETEEVLKTFKAIE